MPSDLVFGLQYIVKSLKLCFLALARFSLISQYGFCAKNNKLQIANYEYEVCIVFANK